METGTFLFILLSALCAVFVLGCSADKPASPFSFEMQTYPETGWRIVDLKYVDFRHPERNIEVKIAPEMGDNLYSMQYGGKELLFGPDSIQALARQSCGIKMLYPTPNRVKNAELRFEDVVLKFTPNNGPNFIHGLVKDIAWEHDEPMVTDKDVTFRTWIDFNESKPFFHLFPYRHRIELDFILSNSGIAFRYRVQNSDSKRLPFGFGIHPYFRILGDKKNVFVKIPAQKRMEAVDKIPTGKLLPMDLDPKTDLRTFSSIIGLNMDDVFWGMRPKDPAVVQYRDAGIQLRFVATDDFTHGVLYTPPSNFFCFENQTCSTDAHNLYSQGFREAAHLLIADPGKAVEGTVKIEIAPLRIGDNPREMVPD